jgi:hypothetical protein
MIALLNAIKLLPSQSHVLKYEMVCGDDYFSLLVSELGTLSGIQDFGRRARIKRHLETQGG